MAASTSYSISKADTMSIGENVRYGRKTIDGKQVGFLIFPDMEAEGRRSAIKLNDDGSYKSGGKRLLVATASAKIPWREATVGVNLMVPASDPRS